MIKIRPVTQPDAKQIALIYNHYIKNTTVTFEEEPVSQEEMARRISDVQGSDLPWLVLEEKDVVVGYAYATKWRARPAYRFSVETTIYLSPSEIRKGFGGSLYQSLIEDLRKRNLHLAIGGIALPNAASVKLHEKLGFEKVAHFKEVGFKMSNWLDVGYWQIAL